MSPSCYPVDSMLPYVRYLRVDDARRREISASMALVQTSDLQAAQTRGLVSEGGWIVP